VIVAPKSANSGGTKMIGKNKSVRLKISEDVILTVARLAALDVKGVAGLDGETGALSKICGKEPVKVDIMGDVAAIDIKIIVKSSANACSVAQAVQTAVKENIQNMTGITVARVNVAVNGIEFDKK
jgi:uncharacterized alkaline shock family protein YloU